jgi:glycosyltransferase involved in cell wall biosynthesis
MGPTLATEVILGSRLRDEVELIHLDTSDHRGIETLGAIDFWNIYLPLKCYVLLFWMILRHRPQVVYVPISQATIGYLKDSGFILIAKVLGRRVLCHLRGGNFRNWLQSASGATRLYVRLVHGLVDGQIVLGQNLKALFAGILPPERIHVVPNGKDVSYGPKPSGTDSATGKVRLLFLANIIRTKGAIDVLHAVPAVVARCPEAEFLFAGAWYEPELKQEIEAFLRDHPQLPVRWLGPLKGQEKQAALTSADIFVFPTYYPPEGHPWVIVEAMAAGLPVISTDQGAILESVEDGINGFIVAKQNPAELADRAIELIQDAGRRRAMGRESRRLYEERFTEERMVANLARAFRAVLTAAP